MNKHCIWSNQCGGEACQTCQHRDDGTDMMDVEFYINDLNERHAEYHHELDDDC